jgi:AcrR family transcriptional regulator
VTTKRTRMSAEQRRESILAAATEVFVEFGYLRGKTAVVAARLGVSEPVVFQNFGTKSALFAAVVRRAADQVCGELDALADLPAAKVLAMFLDPGHLAHVHDAGNVGSLFAEAAGVVDDPEVEAAARDATRRFATTLTGILARARDAGELAPYLDPEAGAWWLLSLVASQRFRRATAPDAAGIEARLARATQQYLGSAPGD